MLSRFFLDRPVFAWVIAIILMVCGRPGDLQLAHLRSIPPSPRLPSGLAAFIKGPRRRRWKTA